ncbi:hypothetical protein [Asticcacaulis sp. YBE204]|uniref:hypothetical protein n=1 Tax=Asticcacaulis sp. YBE204 TaxID=1282363 RepID=UPI0003C3B42B|nr:hypothetical protein [Asticcacaulis sp. YBE204]ESQ80346.1 hypothetical protein AEYBE204_03535 [Asticcacaulis sp. YBE204]
MKDDDFHTLFNTPQRFDDEAQFHDQVMRGLKTGTWLRQGLIALSGIIGGLYALMQFVHLPGWTPAAESEVREVVAKTDTGFEAGLGVGRDLLDAAANYLANGLSRSTDYLTVMQSPLFFWVSFSLCMAIVGLYLVNGREDAL